MIRPRLPFPATLSSMPSGQGASPDPSPPVSIGALFDTARIALAAKDFEGLLETARMLTRSFPDNASGFNLLTQAYMHLDRPAEALEAVQRGLELHPQEPKLISQIVRVLLAKGDPTAAVAFAEHVTASGQALPVAAQIEIVRLQMETRDFDAARASGEALVKNFPERASSFSVLAQSLMALNRPKEAVEVLSRGLKLHSAEAKLVVLLYHANVLLCDTEAALQVARAVVSMRPSDELAHYWVYLSLMSLGRVEDAKEYLTVARDEAPAFDYPKHSSHVRRAHRMARSCPAVPAAWEAGLRNRFDRQPRAQPAGVTEIPTLHYWSQGRPPSDVMLTVAEWNQILAKLGLPEATIYDKESARSWIDANAPEFSRQFSNAFHFAMESDIFRIAFASKRPCIYIDIDSWPLVHAEDILRFGVSQQNSMLYFRAAQPFLNNSFFIAQDGCPYFAELARQSRALDFASLPKDYVTILETFGPVRYNQVLETVAADRPATAAFAAEGLPGVSGIKLDHGRALLFANEVALAAQKPPFTLDYTRTDDHWKGVGLGYRKAE